METRSFIEYQNRYSIGVPEGQYILAEVASKEAWDRRVIIPNSIKIAEINYEYWGSNDPSGPSFVIKSYPINPSTSNEFNILFGEIDIKGHINYPDDIDENTKESTLNRMFGYLNLRMGFKVKERHRFWFMDYRGMARPVVTCSVSEIVYIFQNWKTVEYEFGYELMPNRNDDLQGRVETAIKRVFGKWVDLKSPALKSRYDTAVELFRRGGSDG